MSTAPTAPARGRHELEVFADVVCPFTHVGLRRLVEWRQRTGQDLGLRVRAWPLEVVNGEPLDRDFVAEEVEALRSQVAPNLFAGFRTDSFPHTSRPALTLAAAAYRSSPRTGELVSLELRDLLFEQGEDISQDEVLAEVAARHHLSVTEADAATIDADLDEGRRRGVIGSPHFFTPTGGWFCPTLTIGRDDSGVLHIDTDAERFDEFVASCVA